MAIWPPPSKDDAKPHLYPVLIPSADTVSQVKVMTNASTTEFGRTSGGSST
jgi:hypothetical protein